MSINFTCTFCTLHMQSIYINGIVLPCSYMNFKLNKHNSKQLGFIICNCGLKFQYWELLRWEIVLIIAVFKHYINGIVLPCSYMNFKLNKHNSKQLGFIICNCGLKFQYWELLRWEIVLIIAVFKHYIIQE